ncbi:MAG: hypothetical protein M1829_000721 [Trizodia sp. TS-e1964]|nr:MAG: hypothetical protein M1829_000721 [Trizodia sp. TS-e1964]
MHTLPGKIDKGKKPERDAPPQAQPSCMDMFVGVSSRLVDSACRLTSGMLIPEAYRGDVMSRFTALDGKELPVSGTNTAHMGRSDIPLRQAQLVFGHYTLPVPPGSSTAGPSGGKQECLVSPKRSSLAIVSEFTGWHTDLYSNGLQSPEFEKAFCPKHYPFLATSTIDGQDVLDILASPSYATAINSIESSVGANSSVGFEKQQLPHQTIAYPPYLNDKPSGTLDGKGTQHAMEDSSFRPTKDQGMLGLGGLDFGANDVFYTPAVWTEESRSPFHRPQVPNDAARSSIKNYSGLAVQRLNMALRHLAPPNIATGSHIKGTI